MRSIFRVVIFFFLFQQIYFGEEILVAVASNFSQPMKEIILQYESNHSARIRLIQGSSGLLYAQILHGAPYQMFFSADQKKPAKLAEHFPHFSNTVFTYARGSLVLFSRNSESRNDGLSILNSDSYTHLAFANPKLAPYGKAARDTLQNLGLVQVSKSRWVIGENISQVFQFAKTGNVDLAFLARSQVLALNQELKGAYWPVPDKLYQPILQDAILLSKKGSAIDFFKYCQGKEAQEILRRYGYEPDGI